MIRSAILASVLAAGIATTAHASTFIIDFEEFGVGETLTGVDLGGLTLTAGGDSIATTDAVPGRASTRAIWTEPFTSKPFRAAFASLISSFSVGMGDFGADSDKLFVRAYDAFDNLLASAAAMSAVSFEGLVNLGVSASGISYVEFGSTGTFPNSVFADNLRFTHDTAAPVPLPAGGLLLIGAIGMLAATRRRKG